MHLADQGGHVSGSIEMARDGTHTGFEQYALSNRTAERHSASRFGVRAIASPSMPIAWGLCWSDMMSSTFLGRSPVCENAALANAPRANCLLEIISTKCTLSRCLACRIHRVRGPRAAS